MKDFRRKNIRRRGELGGALVEAGLLSVTVFLAALVAVKAVGREESRTFTQTACQVQAASNSGKNEAHAPGKGGNSSGTIDCSEFTDDKSCLDMFDPNCSTGGGDGPDDKY